MADKRIRFNSRAFHRIISGAGTKAAVHAPAYRMAASAGGGIVVREMYGGYGGGRPIAFVTTTARTPEDAERQREALERAVHGA